MAKRIKRVFTSPDQVLHLWANQSQDDARSRNCYFEGKSCYSYGRHYELGRLTEHKGQTVALINSSGYSVTTSKHICSAYSAASHLIRLKTTDMDASIRDILLENQKHYADELAKLFNSTKASKYDLERLDRPDSDDKKYDWLGWGFYDLEEFNQNCIKLGHKDLALEPDDDFKELYREHILARLKRQEELGSPENEAKREAARLKREEKLARDWSEGGRMTNSLRWDRGPKLIRVVGKNVETSGGATVPLDHALRLLRLVESGRAKSGERVGSFRFNELAEGIVKIGCHNIELEHAKQVLEPYKSKALELVTSETVAD